MWIKFFQFKPIENFQKKNFFLNIFFCFFTFFFFFFLLAFHLFFHNFFPPTFFFVPPPYPSVICHFYLLFPQLPHPQSFLLNTLLEAKFACLYTRLILQFSSSSLFSCSIQEKKKNQILSSQKNKNFKKPQKGRHKKIKTRNGLVVGSVQNKNLFFTEKNSFNTFFFFLEVFSIAINNKL